MKHDYKEGMELTSCVVCCGGEGSLPTDCPGIPLHEKADKVYAGEIDFREGRGWVKPNGYGTSMGDSAARTLGRMSMRELKNIPLGIKVHRLVREALDWPDFDTAPGSKTRHHDFHGGLAAHTYEVVGLARSMASDLGGNYLDLITAAAVWHDVAKTLSYEVKPNGEIVKTKFEDEIGHLVQSWAWFQHNAHDVGLDAESMREIGHAMLAHHGRLEWRSPVEPKTPMAHILHAADMMSMQAAGREGSK